MKCNQINDAGDEIWVGGNGGSTTGTSCPVFPDSTHSSTPVSTKTISSGAYAVTVTLMADADVIATITDANGCTVTCSKHIHADDVRCFAGNSGITKVTLCHKTGSTKNPCVTICVDDDAVNEHLAHGDFLGTCTSNCQPRAITRTARTDTTSTTTTTTGITHVTMSPVRSNTTAVPDFKPAYYNSKLKVKAMPNPSNTYFKVQLSSSKLDRVHVRVTDIAGRVIEEKLNIVPNSTITIGDKYLPGVYIIEFRQGKEKVAAKLIKMYR